MVFDKLKAGLYTGLRALSGALDSLRLGGGFDRRALDSALDELLIQLVEADVALEVAESIVASVKSRILSEVSGPVGDPHLFVRLALADALKGVIRGGAPDIVKASLESCAGGRPLVILFLGVNGVGKTTTIAKIAYMAKRRGVTPVLAASDTFRAGAQEQLEQHALRVGVPYVKGRYGADPASVAVDAINYARARNYCLVLVDTAGRMHVDAGLMDELLKISRVSRPDLKVLVIDALSGNDAVEQARTFNSRIGVDGIIAAKVDADVKGGTILSVSAVTGKPVWFLGVGQGYEDLEEFDPDELAKSLLGLKAD